MEDHRSPHRTQPVQIIYVCEDANEQDLGERLEMCTSNMWRQVAQCMHLKIRSEVANGTQAIQIICKG